MTSTALNQISTSFTVAFWGMVKNGTAELVPGMAMSSSSSESSSSQSSLSSSSLSSSSTFLSETSSPTSSSVSSSSDSSSSPSSSSPSSSSPSSSSPSSSSSTQVVPMSVTISGWTNECLSRAPEGALGYTKVDSVNSGTINGEHSIDRSSINVWQKNIAEVTRALYSGACVEGNRVGYLSNNVSLQIQRNANGHVWNVTLTGLPGATTATSDTLALPQTFNCGACNVALNGY